MDWKLELVFLPVTDIERARFFYEGIGWNVDHDHAVTDDLRFVQVTPPGSGCSIAFGKGLTDAEPGSVKNLQLVVADIDEAHRSLSEVGVELGPIEPTAWGAFVRFSDPDGNAWAVQSMRS